MHGLNSRTPVGPLLWMLLDAVPSLCTAHCRICLEPDIRHLSKNSRVLDQLVDTEHAWCIKPGSSLMSVSCLWLAEWTRTLDHGSFIVPNYVWMYGM